MDLINSTSLNVSVVPLSGNPAVQFYDVYVERASNAKKECRIEFTERPLWCEFSGLATSTRYSIKAKAFLNVYGDCGQHLEKFVTTLAT